MLSTHFDCVPPFFPSDVRDGALYGRGACDAKGILAAQVAAAERLRASGERRVGLLFVVGEERGSDGAARRERRGAGIARSSSTASPPTAGWRIATRGVLRLRLHGDAAAPRIPPRPSTASRRSTS